jgi:hypothetical protein
MATLIDCGAALEAINSKERTPMFMAMKMVCDQEKTLLLFESGARVVETKKPEV